MDLAYFTTNYLPTEHDYMAENFICKLFWIYWNTPRIKKENESVEKRIIIESFLLILAISIK